MADFLQFVRRFTRLAFSGSRGYAGWLIFLSVIVLIGLNAYSRQLVHGLILTGMSDEVSWGLYIANFVFLVGIAAAAVLLVIPVYVYKDRSLKDLVIFGEWMAVAALVMCLAFVIVDMGRPERIWHMLPGIGRMNFPSSLLAWDVIVLGGYLALNLYLASYLLYSRYRGRQPARWLYIPVVFVSIVWAIAIHTVTAFLFAGLGARPFWHSGIIGPRFIASAFTAGPALIILALIVIRRALAFDFSIRGLFLLRRIVQVAMLINVFLLINEVFAEFYSGSLHAASATYLFFGLHGHNALVPWIWTALALNLTAMVLLLLPISRRTPWLAAASAFAVVGIWIEKGMGFVIPGFVPTPLGQVVEYFPTLNELLVVAGIWAFGALCYTLLARGTVGILKEEPIRERPIREFAVAGGDGLPIELTELAD
jgi:Ni/Fe-hydrogenase subunit HybB-like protein